MRHIIYLLINNKLLSNKKTSDHIHKFRIDFYLLFLIALSIQLLANNSYAFEKLEGCFIAEQPCEGFRSIRKQNNPENVTLEVGKSYELLGQNKANSPSHYQIYIPDLTSPARWVELSCGQIQHDCELEADETDDDSKDNYVLAFSWQPAFCESHQSKPECASMTQGRFDATQFTLHGLWPQPRNNTYCGVDSTQKAIDRRKRWDLLDELDLTDETRQRLNIIMPGTQSFLQRHEWIKHGVCYSDTAEEYYTESISLIDQINASELQDLFEMNIGRDVSLVEVKKSLEDSFGDDAGDRISMKCQRHAGDQLIVEFFLQLKGEITLETKIADLIHAAPVTNSNCHEGIVDMVGFQ